MNAIKNKTQKEQAIPRKIVPMPEDLWASLEEAGRKIGITRNAALTLAARKGLAVLAAEYPQQATA